MPTAEGSAAAAISSVERAFGSGTGTGAGAVAGTGFAILTAPSGAARDLRAFPASANATTTTQVATSQIHAGKPRAGAAFLAALGGRAGARSGSMAMRDQR